MKKVFYFRSICSIVILSLALVSCGGATKEAKPVSLTISASTTLQNAMEDINKIYSHEKPNITIIDNFGNSDSLQKAIEQGAKVDILFSSSIQRMDNMESQGFILADTRRNILSNKMILISKNNSTGISDFKDLASAQVKQVALSDPNTATSGKNAKQILKFLGILDIVEPKTVMVKDSKQVLTYVENGKADAGIVFTTDAIQSNKIKIVAIAPKNSHEPIVYPIAILKGCQHISEAKEFIQFLQSPEAEAVFVKYRFIVKHNTPDK